MHCERKAWFKAALVVVLLFSLFTVSAMAMPIMSITNSADGSGYMIVEPSSSLEDGNWIILGGGNAINIPATSFHYIGPETIDYEIGAEYSSLPFFDQLGIGTTYDTASLSLQDFTVPYTTYPVYSESGDKNYVTATFYGSLDWKDKPLNVKLLDLTQLSDRIDFTDLGTIKDTIKQLTLDDIRNSVIEENDITANSSGDIESSRLGLSRLNGMTQGYYALLVVDEGSSLPCIVAVAPIIVTGNDMSTYLLDAAPKPGDSLTIIEEQTGALAGKYTYVVAMIPETSYTTDITMTSDGTVSGTSVRFQGLSLDETMQVTSDGTVDGTTVHIQGLALNEDLSKTDMENVTLLKELAMRELNKSNIAFGVRTTDETTGVEIQVPTRADMPTGKYIVLSAAIDKGTGRIAAINQTTINLGITWTYHLNKDWNLISVPFTPDHTSITEFFPPEALKNITVVWMYNSSNPPSGWWSYYTPKTDLYDQGTLTTISDKYGYWVLSDEDMTFQVRGTVPVDTSLPINSNNWNLVGNPTTQERDVSSVYTDIEVIWQFNGANPPSGWWSYYTPKTDLYDQGTLTILKPGFGYWVLK